MVRGIVPDGKWQRFAPTPWTEDSKDWQALEDQLPIDHLARRVARAVEMLDLGPLFDSYLGVGKKALRPDLLLKLVLYEMHYERPSPAQWARDVRENNPVRWLLFGLEPSRTRLYECRDRIAPLLGHWIMDVLRISVEEGMTPLIFAYDVLPQNNDNGVLEPMVERMVERMVDSVGVKPEELLVDSGYVSIQSLVFCAAAGITLYGPCQENDYSKESGKNAQRNQHTRLPKSSFTWLPEEQVYQCPQGHRLPYRNTQTQRRVDGEIKLAFYICPAEHCQVCERQSDCTSAPHKGRSVSRMENEELLDALRERMKRDEAKCLYKLRSQTVELNYADMKEHRGLRRFHGRGLRHVMAEVATLVLAHNLFYVATHRRSARDPPTSNHTSPLRCAA
ncbi:MAG: transposase [Planctomycetes bacterium]|nr:transposase [Planctomycetota bacterium]